MLTQAHSVAWQFNSLAWLKVTKDDSFLTFGHPKEEGSFGSLMLLSEDEHGEKELFAANRWMHLCFSYQKKDGLLTVVRVCSLMLLFNIFN